MEWAATCVSHWCVRTRPRASFAPEMRPEMSTWRGRDDEGVAAALGPTVQKWDPSFLINVDPGFAKNGRELRSQSSIWCQFGAHFFAFFDFFFVRATGFLCRLHQKMPNVVPVQRPDVVRAAYQTPRLGSSAQKCCKFRPFFLRRRRLPCCLARERPVEADMLVSCH